ncbi:uncharacterized protein PSFLO_01641 [Pseudozyma flocculosa]|uniref:Uncharacterized protein n=1 Tax=Pseudozyma flocculosa TaxID=84751 RepID=A0A5C3EWD0_9BASI|nr:uncharacterized protein PSFLO_01641 [Pseudozyma flocculosa]
MYVLGAGAGGQAAVPRIWSSAVCVGRVRLLRHRCLLPKVSRSPHSVSWSRNAIQSHLQHLQTNSSAKMHLDLQTHPVLRTAARPHGLPGVAVLACTAGAPLAARLRLPGSGRSKQVLRRRLVERRRCRSRRRHKRRALVVTPRWTKRRCSASPALLLLTVIVRLRARNEGPTYSHSTCGMHASQREVERAWHRQSRRIAAAAEILTLVDRPQQPMVEPHRHELKGRWSLPPAPLDHHVGPAPISGRSDGRSAPACLSACRPSGHRERATHFEFLAGTAQLRRQGRFMLLREFKTRRLAGPRSRPALGSGGFAGVHPQVSQTRRAALTGGQGWQAEFKLLLPSAKRGDGEANLSGKSIDSGQQETDAEKRTRTRSLSAACQLTPGGTEPIQPKGLSELESRPVRPIEAAELPLDLSLAEPEKQVEPAGFLPNLRNAAAERSRARWWERNSSPTSVLLPAACPSPAISVYARGRPESEHRSDLSGSRASPRKARRRKPSLGHLVLSVLVMRYPPCTLLSKSRMGW